MISLVRVDDRFIHGQVATQWVNHVSANRIYIVDDFVANDDFMKKMMENLAPKGIRVHVVTVDDACKNMSKIVENDSIKAMVLVKSPEPVLKMIDSGVAIDKLVLGGMGSNPDRKRISKTVAVTEEEVSVIKEIIDRGVHVVNQIVPYTAAEETVKLLEDL